VRNSRILVATFGLVSSFFVFGCASKDTPAAGASCAGTPFDYKTYTAPGTPGRTLTTDIAPILKTSCTLTTACHGSTTATMGQLPHLGGVMVLATDMPTLTAIHDTLVGQPSAQATGLKYVVAGDPENSYLMKKVEGVNACQSLACVKVDKQSPALPACGDKMPAAPSDLLDASTQAIIRDWIKDGAKL
jgi:hypothetical protein